jgi:hypothetical protein
MPKFDPSDKGQLESIRRLLMLRAAKARESLPAFYEFVIREQTTRKPLRCTPHQRVGLDFARDHSRCVRIWPAGSSKTNLVVAETLFKLGKRPTSRGLILSKTRELAEKILVPIRNYIETSAELRMVFPHLTYSRHEPWNQHKIVVDRPLGIPDASLVAVGLDSSIQGSRLDWMIIDDVIDFLNTNTEEPRKKTIAFIESALPRMDPRAQIVFNNTAWHPEDAVHHFAKKWPSIRMTITGDIHIGDDPRTPGKYWDHPILRPKYPGTSDPTCRLIRDETPDLMNDVPLFPERFYFAELEMPGDLPREPATTFMQAVEHAQIDIENKRAGMLPGEFNRSFMGVARDDATAFCQLDWVEKCKRAARDMEHFSMLSKFDNSKRLPTFTGVDLAIGLGEEHDDTAFYTFAILEDRRRLILDIEVGKWPGPVIVQKIVQKQRAYDSVIRVENNAAQDFIRQQALHLDASMPIKPHTTGRTKAHPEYGVPAGFVEMSNGAWIIPNDRRGQCHPHVQKWIDGCLYYTPSTHTNDAVMAWYFAREQAKEWGMLSPLPKKKAFGGGPARGVGGIMDR